MAIEEMVVVGGGISGLSFAFYCAKSGIKPLVLEKDSRVGGSLESRGFDGVPEDFWIELGAHTCYNSYGNLIGILEDLRLLDQVTARRRVGFKMAVGGRLGSISSQLRFPELLLSLPRAFGLRKEGKTVAEYYAAILGRRNFGRVLHPAMNAVICQDAHDFPADLLFKKRSRRKDIPKSFTFRGGIETVTNSLAAHPHIRTSVSSGVREVHYRDDRFIIHTVEGQRYESHALAFATPPDVTASLMRSVSPEAARILSGVGVREVASLGIAMPSAALSIPPLAGIIGVDDTFYSAVSRDVVGHPSFRGLSFHFKPETFSRDSALQRIADVLGISDVRFPFMAEKRNRVPGLRVGHPRLIEEVDRLIAGKPLFLTGNYFAGLAIEDCVSRSLQEFERFRGMKSAYYPCDSL